MLLFFCLFFFLSFFFFLYSLKLSPKQYLKVMLNETIRNDDFYRNTTLQHCCDIVSNSYNIVPILQRRVAL